jgi:RNA polymerase sigma-70 factor (ECF subfamily)
MIHNKWTGDLLGGRISAGSFAIMRKTASGSQNPCKQWLAEMLDPNDSSSKPNDSSPDTLIRVARNGDLEARGRLIDQCRDYLLLVANQELDTTIKGKLGASDLVQESMLAAHGCFDRFEGKTEREFLAWMKGILANQIRHTHREYKGVQKRQIRREAAIDDSLVGAGLGLKDPHLTPSRDAIRNEEATVVQAAIARLPEDYQLVLQLRNWQRMSFEEIGAKLDRSADAARKHWYRAVVKLRTEIKGIQPDSLS